MIILASLFFAQVAQTLKDIATEHDDYKRMSNISIKTLVCMNLYQSGRSQTC